MSEDAMLAAKRAQTSVEKAASRAAPRSGTFRLKATLTKGCVTGEGDGVGLEPGMRVGEEEALAASLMGSPYTVVALAVAEGEAVGLADGEGEADREAIEDQVAVGDGELVAVGVGEVEVVAEPVAELVGLNESATVEPSEMKTFESVCVHVAEPPAAVKPSVAVVDPRTDARLIDFTVVVNERVDDKVRMLDPVS